MRRTSIRITGILLLVGFLSMPAFSLSFPFTFQEKPIRQGSVELIFGSYNMNEPRFDAVYPGGGTMAGLGLSAAIASNVNFYLEIKYYVRKGTLTFTKEKTEFTLVPISLGVRYIFPFGIVNPYAGAGADFYFYYEDNPIGTVLNYTNGYHFLAGSYIQIWKKVPVLINLKLKYTTARAEENSVKIQLGGLEYTASLVFTF